jgi:hypothetical protein
MSVCRTAFSWILLPAPSVIGSLSPRSAAPNQTLEFSSSHAADDGRRVRDEYAFVNGGGGIAELVDCHFGSCGDEAG